MYRRKATWNLASTKLPGKVRLLARVLVNTMALANEPILGLLGHHQLIPIVGH